jgi:uncharacterized protein (DUF934 family)
MLVKGGRIVDDPFVPVADGTPFPSTGAVLVSAQRYLAETDALALRGAPVAVRLQSAESPALLGARVHRLAAVVLHVPYFRDGRAFSWARLLRTRLGYLGEIRVEGHFLRDQVAFFTRVGVDAFTFAQNISPDDIAQALGEISNVYQPSVDGRVTIRELRAAGRPR